MACVVKVVTPIVVNKNGTIVIEVVIVIQMWNWAPRENPSAV